MTDEMDKKVTSSDFFIVCRKCLICYGTNKEAKGHKCEDQINFTEFGRDFLISMIAETKRLDKELRKTKEKLLEMEGKIKLENLKKEMMYRMVEQIYRTRT
jgi:hypothetical protein